MDRGYGLCCGAAIALTAFACSSSGPTAPGEESSSVSGPLGAAALARSTSLGSTALPRSTVTPLQRAGSPVLPEDAAPEHPVSCDPYAGSESAHLSALLGRNLGNRRGARVDMHESCSLFGDGIRVRFVTVASSVTDASARLKCHSLAGAGAQLVPGVGSTSWQSELGVFTAQTGQCLWTQVYEGGSLDPVASRTVAQDVARRWALQAQVPSGQ